MQFNSDYTLMFHKNVMNTKNTINADLSIIVIYTFKYYTKENKHDLIISGP